MTFRVTIPDDPDLPIKEEDKHKSDIKEVQKTIVDAFENKPEPTYIPLESPPLDEIFTDSINHLILLIEEVNPPEKSKVIGKLRGALELFNKR